MKKKLWIVYKERLSGTYPVMTLTFKKRVKATKIIEVAGNECFLYQDKYWTLAHLATGVQVATSFKSNYKQAEIEIMERVNHCLENIEKAFKNQSGNFQIVNN